MITFKQWMETKKICEKCGKNPAQRGNRFCATCKKEILQDMKNSGYLTKSPNTHSHNYEGLPDNFPPDAPYQVHTKPRV
jgi:predicted amidophosphoribosyltransferase